MQLDVSREYIDEWIDTNGPEGQSKLALKAEVSSSLVSKVRNGYVPAKRSTRIKLAEALGIPEAKLFPAVTAAKKKQAS